jgi:hypothetical protein
LEGSASSQKISGNNAAELIGSADHENPGIVGFDEAEASRLGLKAGLTVSVAPTDYGVSRFAVAVTHFIELLNLYVGQTPTQGKLVGLNWEEVVIETKGSTNAMVRVHFPRLGFVVNTSSGMLETKL